MAAKKLNETSGKRKSSFFSLLDTDMAQHNELGKAGEQIAQEFLIKQGYIIRETNWRLNKLEIDIVAEGNGVLHIVEVKTRSHDDKFDPLRSITEAKKRRLIRAANGYMSYHQLKMEIQFDVIVIVGRAENFDLQYIPNAFYPRLRTYR